jgi:16S rRNA (guanine1207-N2)-methyltransferase
MKRTRRGKLARSARQEVEGAAPLPENLKTAVQARLRPPVGIVFGSPRQAVQWVAGLNLTDAVCYQMDLYQAERLREELQQAGLTARVVAAADLWDLSERFSTLIYPVAQGGERMLKVDLIEQAYHVLEPQGCLIIVSPYEHDQTLPPVLKKVYGKVHGPAGVEGRVLWCQRTGDRPRKRHEMTYQVSGVLGASLRFLSRPGVFCYGRFDEGSRALVETMEINPGDHVLDLGCGDGANGVYAGLLSGPEGRVSFVDSNLRALALAEINARHNGLTSFTTLASSRLEDLPAEAFDVVLANPPYYAQASIARLFIERSWPALRPGGRLHLVTRQPHQVEPILAEVYGNGDAVGRRGYTVYTCLREGG